jgi:hypothetical protein
LLPPTGASAIVGAVVFGISYLSRPAPDRPTLDLRSAIWIVPWLVGLAVISCLGPFASPSTLVFGLHHIPFGWDILVVAVFSLAVYYLAMSLRLPSSRVAAEVSAATAEAVPDAVPDAA